MNKDLPRILILSPVIFNQASGSGITMINLFKGWDKNKIAQIHSSDIRQGDFSVCENFFYLERYQTKMPILKQILDISLLITRDIKLISLYSDLMLWVENFDPDLVYVRPSDDPFFCLYSILAEHISHYFKIPYVVRLLDNWIGIAEGHKNPVYRILYNLYAKPIIYNLISRSARNICISREMTDSYTVKFKKDNFTYYHNCIEVCFWKGKQDYRPQTPFQILYNGYTTAQKDLKSLIDIKKSILALNKKGYLTELLIYAPQQCRNLIEQYLVISPYVRFCGFFDPADKGTILSNADLLILPINFQSNYLKYSFQTKFPEYMASGTPILLYGNPENPNISYALQNHIGLVVCTPDISLLTKKIRFLIDSPDDRKKLGRYSREHALNFMDCNIIRKNFRDELISLASQTNETN